MKRGSTLIETMLYVSLATVILFAVVFFFLIFFEIRAKAHAISEVEQQGVHAMEIITATVRGAEAITTPSIGSSAASMTLDVVDGGNDPTVLDLSSGVLRMTEGAGSPITLTSSAVTASALSFANYSRASTPGTIRIQFTLTYVSPSSNQEYTYAKTFVASASLRHP